MVRTRPCRYQCSLPVKLLNSALESLLSPVMVSAFLVWFSVASADATLAVAETGGCKPQAPSRGTETQRRLRASSARNGVCRFGRKALAARRWGRAPKRYRRQPGEKLTAGRRKTVREGSSPDGRDAARPGAPVAQKERGTGA